MDHFAVAEKQETGHHEKQLESHTDTPPSHDPVDLEAPNNESWRVGIDAKHEKRILRKLDVHLLPFVSLLYLLSFL